MHKSSLFSTAPGLLALLAAVIAALYAGATLIAAFLLMLLLLGAGAWLWGRSVLGKAQVELLDGQTACHAGDTLPLTLRVRSKSLFPLIWMDVLVPLGARPILSRDGETPTAYDLPFYPAFFGLKERFVWLLWQQEITCEETLRAHRRGVASIRQLHLQAGDALGMNASARALPLERPVHLLVYPRLMQVDVGPFLRSVCDAEAGARGQTEDVTLLRSSRPYQHGDPMKRINWRYLAMAARMEINQYETITPGCITFALDLLSFREETKVDNFNNLTETRVTLREAAFEQMISLIASLICALNERGLRFALILPGYGGKEPLLFAPKTGEEALHNALSALADVDYAAQEDVRLPEEEIRLRHRKLGEIHLCAYTDVPTFSERFEALGCARLRCIACKREEGAPRAGETPCRLLHELAPGEKAEGGAP